MTVSLGLFLFTFCDSPDPEYKRVVLEEYPALQELISQRDGAALLEFTSHPDSLVRVHAWQALIQTEVEDWDLHLQKVLAANTREAWASLWLKDVNDHQVQYFNSLWVSDPQFKPGLVTLFATHGNEETFRLLMEEPLSGDVVFDRDVAYAIGQRTRFFELNIEQEMALVDKAMGTNDAKLTRGYLYGYYRELYRSEKQFSDQTLKHMLYLWENHYPEGTEGNQMIVRILGQKYFDQVVQHFPMERFSMMNVQLAIEVAQTAGRNEPTAFTPVVLNTLLDHRNSNVRIAALQAIGKHPKITEQLFSDIMNKVALIESRDPYLRMVAFNVIHTPARYREEALAAAGDNPYLQSQKYVFLKKTDAEEDFFEILTNDMSNPNSLNRFYATMALSDWWAETSEEFKAHKKEEIVALINTLAAEKDRSITIALAPFFQDSSLFGDDAFARIEELMSEYSLPTDVEVYQTYSDILHTRFPEESAELIGTWAAVGNKALNSWMRMVGWQIPEGIDKAPEFRTPDWKRLVKLGPNPFLVIETAKGEIIIKLDVLTAPATISGMDSLIKAKAYNWTPFHRVVPNFVVQGGDVESRNGYGGPEYTVPTEASAAMYERGKVGIASAGTDTEGSQFFVMHQWAPHLNARYTIIGEVVEGMSVVDRITQGDMIEKMYWY